MAKKKKFTPEQITEDLKQHLTEHLNYEIGQINFIQQILLDEILGERKGAKLEEPEQRKMWFALNVAFYCHARNLEEFLYDSGGDPKKITPENGKKNAKAFIGYHFKDPPFIKEINNQISHMMYNRTADNQKKLNGDYWPKILDWLKVSLDEFSKELAKQNQYKDITIEKIFIDTRLEQALEPKGPPPYPNTLDTSTIPMGPTGP